MKAKMPYRYYQKAREAKRAEQIAFAARVGMISRHQYDPAASDRWVETGIWADTPKEEKAS